jgi:quercetin dioxygenase-like cupin family protein
MTVQSTKRSGIRIYRAADAPELQKTDFVSAVVYEDDADPAQAASVYAGASPADTRVLVRQTEEEGGYSLVYLFFKPNYPLGRHRHEADCLYIVISGSATMGNVTLHAGDSFFVPAYAPYGYTAGPEGVEVLEFRHEVWSVTTTFTEDSARMFEHTAEAVRENADVWRELTGPLVRANRAAANGG